MTVLEAIDLQAAVEVDEVMLGKMKLLDTVEHVTQFWLKNEDPINKALVENQISLTSAITLGNSTCSSCENGFIVKRSNNITSFTPFLPKDMCEQYLFTQLTLELKDASRRDYTEVNTIAYCQ